LIKKARFDAFFWTILRAQNAFGARRMCSSISSSGWTHPEAAAKVEN
jgi:hypothetical protein